ncbi:MAG: hypothetical protein J0L69_15825 [Bacteroidetes bacterium]|nr:hypothetical protein [Bacteroidota bacterium]
MRKHNGMRPQDIAVLMKIVSLGNQPWQLSMLSNALAISISEISESLNRSRQAKFIDYEKKKINRQNLLEFLEHGIKYVFPQQPGSMVRGIATAHSHPFLKEKFISEMNYVWPDSKGEVIGLSIEPLYPRQIHAVKDNPDFYKLMALIDVIRVGKVREIKFAVEELKKQILNEPSSKRS